MITHPIVIHKPVSNFGKAARKPAPCKPLRANLIVVNFTAQKLAVFVKNKKIGTVAAQDQKKFKQVLPVGDSRVRLVQLGQAAQTLAEQNVSIAAQGKKTCKYSESLVVGL